jgi:uncharacterized protein
MGRTRGAATFSRRLVGLVAAGLLAGCATPVAASGPGDAPAGQPPVVSASMRQDERTAVATVDAYWRRNFRELSGREYRSPRVLGGYVGTGGPRCAGQPSVPFNAFYCPAGDFLAWDVNLMKRGYDQIGDAWVYLIIAHEWAHAVQARLDRAQVSVAAELQADCLAGAALAGAGRDGLITFEPGDREELGRTLAAVADDFPWTSERDHGDTRQRISAFSTGATGGEQTCV